MQAARTLKAQGSRGNLSVTIEPDCNRIEPAEPPSKPAAEPSAKKKLTLAAVGRQASAVNKVTLTRNESGASGTSTKRKKSLKPRRGSTAQRPTSPFRPAVGVAVLVAEGAVPQDAAAGSSQDDASTPAPGSGQELRPLTIKMPQMASSSDALEYAAAPTQSDDARLLEPLACVLEPLIELEESGVSRKKKQGGLTLSILLSVTELAWRVAQHERGVERQATLRDLIAANSKSVALTVQQQTAARRVKSSLNQIKTGDMSDEKEAALGQIVEIVEKNKKLMAVIVEEGGIAPIVQMADRGSQKSKEQAATILRRLAELRPEHKVAIAKAGGIAAIVKIVGAGSSKPSTRVEAAMTLATLARGHEENQNAVAAAGAIKPLVKLLAHEQKEEQLAAASALCALCAQNADNCKKVVAEDGVAPLARCILPAVVSATSAASALQQKTALEALHGILHGARRSAVPSGKLPGRLASGWGSMRQMVAPEPPPEKLSAAEEALKQLAIAFPEAKAPTVGVELVQQLVALAENASKSSKVRPSPRVADK